MHEACSDYNANCESGVCTCTNGYTDCGFNECLAGEYILNKGTHIGQMQSLHLVLGWLIYSFCLHICVVCIFVSMLSPRLTYFQHVLVFCVDNKVLHDTLSFTRHLSLYGYVYAFLL